MRGGVIGFFAALNATYNINVTVSYTASHVNATVEYKQYQSLSTVTAVRTPTNINQDIYKTDPYEEDTVYFNDTTSATQENGTAATFPFSPEVVAYKVEIKITNTGTTDITATVQNGELINEMYVEDNNNWFISIPADSKTQTINQGQNKTLYIYVGLEDLTEDILISDNAVEIVVELEKISLVDVSFNLTNLTTSNQATKIPMGVDYTITLSPASSFSLPSQIIVTGVSDFSYNPTTGVITIQSSAIQGNITITAVADSLVQQLATPSISLNNHVLSWAAISNATSYSVLSSSEEVATTASPSINLSTVLTNDGNYAITVIAKSTNPLYTNSNPSNSVSYNVAHVNITFNLTNLTTSNQATKILMGTDYTTTLSPTSSFSLPSQITITGASTFSYNSTTGVITIQSSAIQGNITITAVADSLVQQLATPSISLSGDVLSWATIPNATSYSVQRTSGAQIAVVTSTSIDLSEMLTSGYNTIIVIAKSTNPLYADSTPSNSVNYNVSSSSGSGGGSRQELVNRILNSLGQTIDVGGRQVNFAADFPSYFNQFQNFLLSDEVELTEEMVSTVIANIEAAATTLQDVDPTQFETMADFQNSSEFNTILANIEAMATALDLNVEVTLTGEGNFTIQAVDSAGRLVIGGNDPGMIPPQP